MSQFGRLAVQAFGSVALAGALLSGQLAHGQPGGQPGGQSAPPKFIHDEIQRAENDFASGGARALAANWGGCVERVNANHDANAAERCIVYGYSALLLGESGGLGGGAPSLNEDAVTAGQLVMLDVMGIPSGARQAWLDRFRRQVAESYRPDRLFASGSGFTSDGAATPDRGFREMPERAVASNTPPPPSGNTSHRPAAPGRADLGPDALGPDALGNEVTPVSGVAPALGYTPSFGPSQVGPSQFRPSQVGPSQFRPSQLRPPQSGQPQPGQPVTTDDAAVEPRADL